jgi:hypothetical protein
MFHSSTTNSNWPPDPKKVVGCNRFQLQEPIMGYLLFQYLCKVSVSGILPVPLFRNVTLGKKGKYRIKKMPKRENK